MGSGTNHGSGTIGLRRNICDVLAAEQLPHVAEIVQRRTLFLVFRHAIHCKSLVMRYREDVSVIQECGMVYRCIMIKGLNNDLVFVCDPSVVDIDQAVSRSRQQDVWIAWVEIEFTNIIAVHLLVFVLRRRRGTNIPPAVSRARILSMQRLTYQIKIED